MEKEKIINLLETFIMTEELVDNNYVLRLRDVDALKYIIELREHDSTYNAGLHEEFKYTRRVLEIEYYAEKNVYWFGLYKSEWYERVNPLYQYWGSFERFEKMMENLRLVLGVEHFVEDVTTN